MLITGSFPVKQSEVCVLSEWSPSDTSARISALTSCGQRTLGLAGCAQPSCGSVAESAFSARSRENHHARFAGEVVFQGAGVITPDGLPSLTCVDLMRGLGDGESLSVLVQVRV